MELKAKEAFDAWYINKVRQRPDIGNRFYDEHLLKFLDDAGNTIKNAHYVEWLDSLGIYVYVDPVMSQGIYYWRAYIHYFECEGNLRQEQYYASRQEATEAAIKKAVEIFNNR